MIRRARDALPRAMPPSTFTRARRPRRGYVDEVIAPGDTRARLTTALETLDSTALRRWPAPGTPPVSLLTGKRLLVTGVLTRGSIAFEVARQAQESAPNRTERIRTRHAPDRARRQSPPAAARGARARRKLAGGTRARRRRLAARWDGSLDGVLHAIAFAPADALGGGFLDTPAASAVTAFQTSAFSLEALAAALAPLLEEGGGGAVVGLDFDAAVAWPVYDWMGVAKPRSRASRAIWRATSVRAACASTSSPPGPIETIAAGGIPGFEELAGLWRSGGAPLSWDTRDASPVAGAVCFLLSATCPRDHGRDPPRRRRLSRDGGSDP